MNAIPIQPRADRNNDFTENSRIRVGSSDKNTDSSNDCDTEATKDKSETIPDKPDNKVGILPCRWGVGGLKKSMTDRAVS